MEIDKNFYKKLAGVAVPIALQGLVSSSLTLLDNLMVSSLSEAALSSVGLAIQIFGVHWMMIFGFCTGCSTFYTQFWGLRDSKSIKKVLGLAVVSCSALSLIYFTAAFFFPNQLISLFTNDPEVAKFGADYLRYAAVNFIFIAVTQPVAVALRATQQTKLPMIAAIISFITDVIFNYLFIFGKFGFPRLEVAGAAIATVIARVIECLIILFFVFGRNNILSGSIKEYFSFSKNFARRIYLNSIATTCNETFWGLAIACHNAAFGHMGVTAYAAYAAAINVMDLFQNMAWSVGDATLIFVGEQLGRGEKKEAKRIAGRMLKIGMVFAAFIACLIILSAKPVLSFFNLSRNGSYLAYKIVLVRALLLPIDIHNAVQVTGILRAGGDTRFAAISEICTMYLLSVPMAFLGLKLGLPIYLAVFLTRSEGFIKAAILLKRYLSGKWINNVVDELR